MSDRRGDSDTGGTERSNELTIQLSVPEMDCFSCAGKVDKSLQRAEGVTETELRPTTGAATVTYDSDRASREDVIAAVDGAGYEVETDGSDSGAETDGVEIAPPSET
jgi:Cd2+/Zn2+-exporting ATPase